MLDEWPVSQQPTPRSADIYVGAHRRRSSCVRLSGVPSLVSRQSGRADHNPCDRSQERHAPKSLPIYTAPVTKLTLTTRQAARATIHTRPLSGRHSLSCSLSTQGEKHSRVSIVASLRFSRLGGKSVALERLSSQSLARYKWVTHTWNSRDRDRFLDESKTGRRTDLFPLTRRPVEARSMRDIRRLLDEATG